MTSLRRVPPLSFFLFFLLRVCFWLINGCEIELWRKRDNKLWSNNKHHIFLKFTGNTYWGSTLHIFHNLHLPRSTKMQISPQRTPSSKAAQPLRHKLWSFESTECFCIHFYLFELRFAIQYLFKVKNIMISIKTGGEIFFWSCSFLSKWHDVKCRSSRIYLPEACTHRTGEGSRKESGRRIRAAEW